MGEDGYFDERVAATYDPEANKKLKMMMKVVRKKVIVIKKVIVMMMIKRKMKIKFHVAEKNMKKFGYS